MKIVNIRFPLLFISAGYFLTMFLVGTSYSHPSIHSDRISPHSPLDHNRKPFQVFDSIGFMNKPDLFPVGLRLLPVLDFYEIKKEDFGSNAEQNQMRAQTEYWPLVIPWVLRDQNAITWQGFWDKKPLKGEYLEGSPNISRVRDSAMNLRNVPYQFFYLNIEPDQLSQLKRKDQWEEAISILSIIIKEIRQELPYTMLGYYSIMPSVNYRAPVSLQLEWETCKQSGRCREASGVKWKKWNEELIAWQKQNRSFQELAKYVDVIFPALYTPYLELCATTETGENEQKNSSFFPLHRDTQDRHCNSANSHPNPVTEWSAWQVSRQGWQAYAITNIQEARKYHKPVYAFL